MPKLIKIVVPFSPGGNNDAIARAIAGPLSKRLDASVIVENRPGAGGAIGATVARSAKDGSVLLLTSSSFLTAAATQPQFPTTRSPVSRQSRWSGGDRCSSLSRQRRQSRRPIWFPPRAPSLPPLIRHGRRGLDRSNDDRVDGCTCADPDDARSVQGGRDAVVDLACGQIQVMISNQHGVADDEGGKIERSR